ncbi:MAG: MoaD family protein [Anaerolineaceae bacterium]|nr:MAG: MoaD family protein [Anaerolineaceae bacterium]
MPILRIPTPLHAYASDAGVSEALSDLATQHSVIKPHLFNGNDELRPFVNLFIDQDNTEDLQGIATSIKDGEEIAFVPSIAGG